jgi:hypothetical protein
MKIEINISNKVFYALMTLVVITLVGVGVLATPNPGHRSNEIDEADPQVGTLSNGQWCKASGSGSSGEIDCTENPPTMTETDPTVDIDKLKSLVSNDFHNLGGTDDVGTDNQTLAELTGYTTSNTITVTDGQSPAAETVIGSGTINTITVTSNTITANGDIVADSNTRTGCAWLTVTACDDLDCQLICSGNRYLAGYKLRVNTDDVKEVVGYCCEL